MPALCHSFFSAEDVSQFASWAFSDGLERKTIKKLMLHTFYDADVTHKVGDYIAVDIDR
jgi:hypothetical protein